MDKLMVEGTVFHKHNFEFAVHSVHLTMSFILFYTPIFHIEKMFFIGYNTQGPILHTVIHTLHV